MNLKLLICIIIFGFLILSCVSADDTPNDLLNASYDANLSSSHHVSGNSFSDIRSTIADSKSGDTIYLSGTYNGDGNSITVNKDRLTIKSSSSSSKAVLNVDGKNSRIFTVTASNVRLENLIFENMDSNELGAVSVSGTHFTIIDCDFINNKGMVGGLYIRNDADYAVVRNCNFISNQAIYGDGEGGTNGGGIDSHASHGTYQNCNFQANHASTRGGGVFFIYGSDNKVQNCHFENNTATGGSAVYATVPTTLTVENSNFKNNKASDGGSIYNRGNLTLNKCNFT